MKTTEQQKETRKYFYDNGFKFPCCNTEITHIPDIENKGEENTQIYCPYCRMYIFLDDYKKQL